MPNKYGIQIIWSKPLSINVTSLFILNIKNIQSIHQCAMSIENIIVINWTKFVLYYKFITINLFQTWRWNNVFCSKQDCNNNYLIPKLVSRVMTSDKCRPPSNSPFANILASLRPCNNLQVWIIDPVSNTQSLLEDKAILISILFIPEAEVSLPFFFFFRFSMYFCKDHRGVRP